MPPSSTMTLTPNGQFCARTELSLSRYVLVGVEIRGRVLRRQVRLKVLHELERLPPGLIVDLQRITAGLPEELGDGDADRAARRRPGPRPCRRRPAPGSSGRGRGSSSHVFGGCTPVLLEAVRRVVVGDLHVRPRRQEVVGAVELSTSLQRLDRRRRDHLFGLRQRLDQLPPRPAARACCCPGRAGRSRSCRDPPAPRACGSTSAASILINSISPPVASLKPLTIDVSNTLTSVFGQRDATRERRARPRPELDGASSAPASGPGQRTAPRLTGARSAGRDGHGDARACRARVEHFAAVEPAGSIGAHQVLGRSRWRAMMSRCHIRLLWVIGGGPPA